MRSHLERLGNRLSVPIETDTQGFLGRECPKSECLGYFKVKLGTGLKGNDLPCHCPYCGHTDAHDTFWTKEQIEYARSVAVRQVTEAFRKDLKKMEFNHKPRGPFGIGISMKLKPGSSHPIRYYREKQLETEVVCDDCSLDYTIYGVFAFCPDCGTHNSLHILMKNLELVNKMVSMAAGVDQDLSDHLVGNALEDSVSAFDGFGREMCRLHAARATNPVKAATISFQNLKGARQNVLELFGYDMVSALSPQSWNFGVQCFQKRHLLAHSMGVVDAKYVTATGDARAKVGRKISITTEEVSELVSVLQDLGCALNTALNAVTPSP